MKLTLVRHSKTVLEPEIFNPLWVLSDDGVRFAQEFALKQEIKDVQVFYASLQNKALETAVLLAKPHHTPIKTDKRLTEITSLTTKFAPKEEFEKMVHDLHNGTAERFNEGESVKEALERFNAAVEDIVKAESGKENVGIVAHSNILSFFAAQYSEKSSFEIHETIKMPDVAILDWDSKEFLKLFSE